MANKQSVDISLFSYKIDAIIVKKIDCEREQIDRKVFKRAGSSYTMLTMMSMQTYISHRNNK